MPLQFTPNRSNAGQLTFASNPIARLMSVLVGATGADGSIGIDGVPAGQKWSFDSSIVMAAPGTGDIRLNNADPSLVTSISVSAQSTDTGNPDISDFIVTWDDSTNPTIKGHMTLAKVGAVQNFAIYSIQSVTDNGTWLEIAVTHVDSAGTFVDGDPLAVPFIRSGDQGASGAGTGDVIGPAIATDNAIARFDTTTGKLIQNSAVTIADTTGLTAGMTFPNANGVRILDTDASHLLTVKPGSNITADRTLTVTTGDTDIIVNLTAVTDEFVLAYDTGTNTWRGVAAAASVPTTITVADEATDTTCFVAFFTAATGDLEPKTNATLTYNSNTDALSIGVVAPFTTGTIELGHASDTTLARVSAGVVSIEGSNILTEGTAEAFVETAIDTLANLTSVQGLTVTLADAGANAFFGWDDVAGAYENLTAAEAEAIIEPLIDTLANLTSIQGLTVTLADAGANAFFGWDDVAGAYENLTAAEAEAIIEPLIDTLANLTSIQGFTVTFADAGFDVLSGWDDSAAAHKNFLLADILTEAAPAAGDFLLAYGAEGDLRKVNWSSLPGAGGGISNVSEDTSPTLGGNLEGAGFSLGTTGSQASDVFLEEGGVINWDGGDLTLTQTGNLLAVGGGTLTGASVDTATETAVGVVELATTAEVEAGTDTTRAVTAAGVLAAISGKQTIWIPAHAMVPRTTNGAATGTTQMATNANMFRTFDFDTATQEFVQFSIRFPKSWNEGTITFFPVWSHAATVTNFGVVWAVQAVAIGDNEAGDVAFGTEQTSTDTGGTTNNVYHGPESAAITIAGTIAENDFVMIVVKRNVADGGDTLAVDARLHGIAVMYTNNAFTDD